MRPQPHANRPPAPASSAPDKRPGRARTEALPQAPPAAGAGACTAKSQPSSRRCGAARTSAATYLGARGPLEPLHDLDKAQHVTAGRLYLTSSAQGGAGRTLHACF
jgi:hypothetical protein